MSGQIENARSLRKRLTSQEVKVWVKLRELRLLGLHFRRQMPIGSYIVDFACRHSGLIVEIDGGQHGLQDGVRADVARDAFLKSQGFRVLRFWNSDVDRNLNGVMEAILTAVQSPHPTRLRAPPSPDGGGMIRPCRKPIPPREGRVDGPKGQPGGAANP